MAIESGPINDGLDQPERESSLMSDEGDISSQETVQERIARRAYERFQARGSEHGRATEDWLEAERELGERPE